MPPLVKFTLLSSVRARVTTRTYSTIPRLSFLDGHRLISHCSDSHRRPTRVSVLQRRALQNLGPKHLEPVPGISPKTPPGPVDLSGPDNVTVAEQRRSDWTILKKLVPHVWPRDDWTTRGRVVLGFGLLISGKVR